MFISIGWNNVVRAEEVVAILEHDQAAKTVDPTLAENDEAGITYQPNLSL